MFEGYKQALLDLGYPEDSIAREYCNDLSRRFRRMIANFCRTGDPSTEDMQWPVYTAEDRRTMMTGQNMRVEKNPEAARVEAALKMVDAL